MIVPKTYSLVEDFAERHRRGQHAELFGELEVVRANKPEGIPAAVVALPGRISLYCTTLPGFRSPSCGKRSPDITRGSRNAEARCRAA